MMTAYEELAIIESELDLAGIGCDITSATVKASVPSPNTFQSQDSLVSDTVVSTAVPFEFISPTFAMGLTSDDSHIDTDMEHPEDTGYFFNGIDWDRISGFSEPISFLKLAELFEQYDPIPYDQFHSLFVNGGMLTCLHLIDEILNRACHL